jgi:AmmeMemoRadiSam system protein A
MAATAPGDARITLSASEAAVLIRMARRALASHLGLAPPGAPPEVAPALRAPGRAFVSLHVGGELRGCVGILAAEGPLAERVAELAVAAATADDRFQPLAAEEWDRLSIAISLLSAPRPVARLEEIHVGTHGLVVERERRRGLLLPQVATEQGWDRLRFLEQTCVKAGIPPRHGQEWARGTPAALAVAVFTASIVDEARFPSPLRPER